MRETHKLPMKLIEIILYKKSRVYPVADVNHRWIPCKQGRPKARRGWARAPGLKILGARNFFFII